jgi:predicted DCC family thiol-disulfide oxidoreductase YuxK
MTSTGSPEVSLQDKDPLLIFDGDCGFCTSAVNGLQKRMKRSFDVIPYQFANLEKYQLTTEECEKRIYLITVDKKSVSDKQFSGHKAISKIWRMQTNPLWKFLGWVIIFPGINLISYLAYWLMARYRHKLPGGTPACQLPR